MMDKVPADHARGVRQLELRDGPVHGSATIQLGSDAFPAAE